MANASNTGSTLGLASGANKTSSALSTNIIIQVNGQSVGAIQSISVNETRAIKFIDEVGTDGHVDSSPSASSGISGNCTRIRFDRLRIAEAFGRGFIHARSQVYPFDIHILDKQKRDSNSHITTIIKNVWIKGIQTTYQAGDWVISDQMDWEAETIYSFLAGNISVAQGGERAIKHFGSGKNGVGTILMGENGSSNNIEQLTDRGESNRRGSLDAAGLIDIGESDGIF